MKCPKCGHEWSRDIKPCSRCSATMTGWHFSCGIAWECAKCGYSEFEQEP